ncbi:MAG: tyrosine-type recombinase/integrase [Prochloraceae cyanobacterium]|nr:tyrosine-type recombinase/integrase [Prochloraceae cyanobacterium]
MLQTTEIGSFSAKFLQLNCPPVKQAYSGEREYLLPHEVENLIKAARHVGRHGLRDGTIILLMFRHGLRSAELVALKWLSVDLKDGYLAIHRVKHGHDSVHPLRSPELRALRQLKLNYPDTQYLFVSERKAPLSTRSIRQIISRAGKLAGLPFPVHSHQLRHACGYYLAASGHDTRAIQDYLGHRNIQHTVRYTRLSPSRAREFLARLICKLTIAVLFEELTFVPTVAETAYPRLKNQFRERELREIYTPTKGELSLASQHTRKGATKLGFLVLLKTFQRLGYFVSPTTVPRIDRQAYCSMCSIGLFP